MQPQHRQQPYAWLRKGIKVWHPRFGEGFTESEVGAYGKVAVRFQDAKRYVTIRSARKAAGLQPA